MSFWLLASLFALVAWSFQRLLTKIALASLGSRKFYLLSAAVSLIVYVPYLIWRPPGVGELAPAFALACLIAITFGVTTEAVRRGPLGVVSPITALSPALTALLAIALLRERLPVVAYFGIAAAPIGVALLSSGLSRGRRVDQSWMLLASLSLLLQGLGAFIAKVVVTPAGPSALLLMSAAVQVVVGVFLAPPTRWRRNDLWGRAALYTVVAYAVAAIATIGYLLALSTGPAAVVVPLVAVSPAVGGILGIVFLKEPTGWRQLVGIGLALIGAVLLAAPDVRP